MTTVVHIIRRLTKPAAPWLAWLVGALGGILYAVQSSRWATSLISPLDEGNYLYKGWLFATGAYTPFQDYGVWTNKMPLAFLIPGWVQAWFGEGLRTGRTFAVILGVLLIVALWLTTKRMAGAWWAAVVVWALALNPALIKLYSLAISQGLVACQLAWLLFFLLGDNRKTWHILAGSLLAAAMVLTRQNMVMVLPLAWVYVVWQHGWKKGWLALAAMALPVLAVHAAYWPNILKIWLPWLPRDLTPFLDFARTRVGGTAFPAVGGSLNAAWLSVGEALRYHLLPIAGTLFTMILIPWSAGWRSAAQRKTTYFLLALMLVLTGMHLAAAVGSDYCPYCASVYLAFFSFVGLLLVAVSFSAWQKRPALWRSLLLVVVTITLFAGVGFGGYQQLAGVLTAQVPRISGGALLPGATDLWRLLANKFQLSYKFLEIYLPTAAAVLSGGLLVVAAVVLTAVVGRRRLAVRTGWLMVCLVLALGLVLSPLPVLAGSKMQYECPGTDIITSYEAAGVVLAKQIPDGSTIYWRGGSSPTLLLYLPQAHIYPPQLNDTYNYRVGGNSDLILKGGGWNDGLAAQWLAEADYVLVEDRNYHGALWEAITPQAYDELTSTAPIYGCVSGSKIRLFRRNP